MIVAGSASPLLLASAAGGYNLTRSLRFRKSASAKLTRTPSTAGDRRTFTASMWLKRGLITNVISFLSADTNGGSYPDDFVFYDNKIAFFVNGSINGLVQTQAVFRDPSAWYHIVLVVDTTQATDTNRVKIYVNGVQQTTTGTYPTLNYQTYFNSVIGHQIGNSSPDNNYYDGYMTEINFIDGQALTPSSFGANNASTGVWQPKKYAGTYGTNGFYLPFSDNASTTTLGNDFSGNGNNWTTNNISLTAGSTYDSMTDVPTLTDETTANYCVVNPIDQPMQGTVSNGNLTFTGGASSQWYNSFGSFSLSSGKWYWEVTIGSVVGSQYIGASTTNGSVVGTYNYSVGYWSGGSFWKSNGDTPYATDKASYTTGDVIGVALDIDNQTIEYFKNNTSQGTINSIGAYSWKPAISVNNATVLNINFGQRPFAYTPPTGFVALNTFNLPTPTIGATASTLAEKYMDISLYSGTSASGNNITDGLSLSSGGLLWVKNRNATGNHALVDSVRGITKRLISDSTNAEDTVSAITSFNSNGFTLEGSDGSFNLSGRTYVAWQWLANGSGVSNTDGSITSTVSANTSAGFSVVTYAGGQGSDFTIGHGLGVAPNMVITKSRNATGDWGVYYRNNGVNTNYMVLNSTSAQGANDGSLAGGAYMVMNSSTLQIASSSFANGASSMVAYCFSEVAGYSKFGSYTGNGSTDGTFVYTGFRPRFVMIKNSSSGGTGWSMWDSSRNTYNLVNTYLQANADGAEATQAFCDFTSNGFKIRDSSTFCNGSGNTIIYMAFGENPFKYSLAR